MGLPDVVRMECHCGCGVWFYQPRKKGRRRLYVNLEHWYREKWRREKKRRAICQAETVVQDQP